MFYLLYCFCLFVYFSTSRRLLPGAGTKCQEIPEHSKLLGFYTRECGRKLPNRPNSSRWGSTNLSHKFHLVNVRRFSQPGVDCPH